MSRLSKALLVALALHGLLLLTRGRHSRSLPSPVRATQTERELVELEETSVEAAPDLDPAAGKPAPPSRASNASQALGVARSVEHSAAPLASPAASPAGDVPSNAEAPAGVGAVSSAEPNAAEPARKIDLGLDDGFFMRPPSEQLPRIRKPEFQRQLEASLSADDVRRGLARGNELISSLNAAVRDSGPVRGEALLSVTVGPDGGLTGVEFVRGSPSEWSSALESFRALAARKHLRVPPGARGLRVTFSVQAKVQRPSGKEVNESGMDVGPPGFALHGTFDLADLAAGPQRLVYARVVSEEVL